MVTQQEAYKKEFEEFKRSLKQYLESNLALAQEHHKDTHRKMLNHAKKISNKFDKLEEVVKIITKVKK